MVNQIAAGEVVERPSSVIKELVENSLDAGANRIDVLLGEGGIRSIAVLDNGCGMSAADLTLCVEKHTTSKLHRAADLEAVSTFGFRGEALASIASVSEIEIKSRPRDGRASDGAAIRLQFGEVVEGPRPVAVPEGTSIIVDNLFLRVPARQKFLRSAATEYSHCAKIFKELALGNPHVRFYLQHQGRRCAEYVAPTREGRFGECFRTGWKPLAVRAEASGAKLEAYLSPADRTSERGEMLLYVNARAVRNRNWLAAVRNAYASALGARHEPSGVVYLDIRYDWIDVNVHPQKMEVRCWNQETLYPWILSVVRKALAGAEADTSVRRPQGESSGYSRAGSDRPEAPEAANRERLGPRYLGKVRDNFLLYEDDRGLVVIDPTAWRGKKRFDELRLGGARALALSAPKIFRLDHERATTLRAALPGLAAAGWEIEVFGEEDFSIRACADYAEGLDAETVLRAAVDAMRTDGESGRRTLVDHIYAHCACRHDEAPAPFAAAEHENLGTGFSLDDNAATCPHGRPVLVRVEFEKIERQFQERTRWK